MQRIEMWLTPEEAATTSGRSMIAIRALVQATSEDDGTRHLLQIRETAEESVYLLHRSLVSSEGLGTVGPDDVIERLSARIAELEAENEVLRLRSSSMRHEASTGSHVQPAPQPQEKQVVSRPLADTGYNGSFWLVLGGIILTTFVIVLYILYKQGVFARYLN